MDRQQTMVSKWWPGELKQAVHFLCLWIMVSLCLLICSPYWKMDNEAGVLKRQELLTLVQQWSSSLAFGGVCIVHSWIYLLLVLYVQCMSYQLCSCSWDCHVCHLALFVYSFSFLLLPHHTMYPVPQTHYDFNKARV